MHILVGSAGAYTHAISDIKLISLTMQQSAFRDILKQRTPHA